MAAELKQSLRLLLTSAIDYAGLFPPADLDLQTAVANYRRYREGEREWALGRFVTRPGALPPGLPLSVVVGPVMPILTGVRAEAIELKQTDAEQIKVTAKVIPNGWEAFYEIPPNRRDLLETVGRAGARAKIRTGGVTHSMFPSSEAVAQFMRDCADLNVPFKATAGLHHALRSEHPFTYQPDSPCGTMHGFLNVSVAAVLAFSGAEPEWLIRALEERDAASFQFEDDGISFAGHFLTNEQIKDTRRKLFLSFGSCSFEEPVSELQDLGLL